MPVKGSLVKALRKDLKITQAQLAEAIGVSKTSVASWENEIFSPEGENLDKLMKFFHVSADYLLGKTEKQEPMARQSIIDAEEITNVKFSTFIEIPVLSMEMVASCGAGNGLYGVDSQAVEITYIDASLLSKYDDMRKPFAIHTEGDSMEGAGLEEGSIAIINPAEDVISGDTALVVWNDNWFIKWVVWNPDDSVELRSANPNYGIIKVEAEYASNTEWFRIIGKVISIIKQSKPKRAF